MKVTILATWHPFEDNPAFPRFSIIAAKPSLAHSAIKTMGTIKIKLYPSADNQKRYSIPCSAAIALPKKKAITKPIYVIEILPKIMTLRFNLISLDLPM